MYLVAVFVWVAIAVLVARLLSRAFGRAWIRRTAFVVLLPMLLVLPLIDELIGKPIYDRLCREAEEVQIHSTIAVREPFYTSDGRWRRSQSGPPLKSEEGDRIIAAYEALVRYENTGPTIVQTPTMPIARYDVRIVNPKTGVVLATMQQYATRGGWLSRMFETPILVRAQCLSPSRGEILDQKILPFDRSLGNGR
jgi:hypothetical protein